MVLGMRLKVLFVARCTTLGRAANGKALGKNAIVGLKDAHQALRIALVTSAKHPPLAVEITVIVMATLLRLPAIVITDLPALKAEALGLLIITVVPVTTVLGFCPLLVVIRTGMNSHRSNSSSLPCSQ